MKTVSIKSDVLQATIEVLWGPEMPPVVDRVYGVIDRLTKQAFEQGREAGIQDQLNEMMKARTYRDAPPATLNPVCEWKEDKLPTPPEQMYRKDMWPDSPAPADRLGADELVAGFGLEDADCDGLAVATANNACGRSSALCPAFPTCGCAG